MAQNDMLLYFIIKKEEKSYMLPGTLALMSSGLVSASGKHIFCMSYLNLLVETLTQ